MAETDTSSRGAAGKGSGRSRSTAGERAEREASSPRREPVCPVAFCPVGLALGTVQQAGPEVVDHLLAAAREFLLAARAVIDQRAEGFDPRRSVPLERIEIA